MIDGLERVARRSAGLSGALIAAVVLTTCGGQGSTHSGPAAPSSPAAVVSVGIGGLPGQLNVDQRVQLRAIAIMSNASTSDVTAQATFSATRADVASVSPQGLLTGMAPGKGGIRIDYQAVSGQWLIDVVGPDIAGYVHENSPRNLCLSGARVEVADGAASGVILAADNDGRFTIPNRQTAPFTLNISKAGYGAARFVVASFPGNTSADIVMTPTARIVDRVWTGTFAPDQCDTSDLRGGKRSLFFTAGADGVFVINRVGMYVIDVGGWDLLQGSNRLPLECRTSFGAYSVYSVTRGVEYELQVRGYGCGPNLPYHGDFFVEFSRPE
jgi:hypothetical protein